jgi:hypothetical protein
LREIVGVIRHLFAVCGLGLLCAGWVKVQLWAQRDRLESGSQSSRYHGLCAPDAQRACMEKNSTCSCEELFVEKLEAMTQQRRAGNS